MGRPACFPSGTWEWSTPPAPLRARLSPGAPPRWTQPGTSRTVSTASARPLVLPREPPPLPPLLLLLPLLLPQLRWPPLPPPPPPRPQLPPPRPLPPPPPQLVQP